MIPLIQRTLTDEHLYPRVKTGELKGKPVYKTPFNETDFYEVNGVVYVNFTSSENKQMRYKYEYKFYDTSHYCEKHNVPLEERPTTQPFDMLTVRTEFVL